MEFFRRAWATIQVQINKLPVSSRLLIGALMVILLMAGFLALQYAASPEMVPLVSTTADRVPAILVRLQNAGVKAQSQGGQILVASDKRDTAYAALAEGELLAGNNAAAFDDMVKNQNPWTTKDQNTQAYLLAKRKVLSQIISKMAGVQSADVMLDKPDNTGFGDTHHRPTGAVNVVMRGGNSMNKKLVEAIASLVAGAMVEMKPEDVVIIDANEGRQFTVKKRDNGLSDDTIESLQAQEHMYEEKITRVLGYIHGVIVGVNVRLDPILVKTEVLHTYTPDAPLKSEESVETSSREASAGGGEAGARPNVGVGIDSGAGAGSSNTSTKTRSEYGDTKELSMTTQQSVGGMARQVSVTVNVPRSFLVAVFKQGKPPDAPEPDDAALEIIKTAQLAQVEAQVKPLISTDSNGKDVPGVVNVNMIPDGRAIMMANGSGGGGSGGGSGSSGAATLVLEGAWIKPAGVAALALVSLALMFGMVRKATQQTTMPSIEALAGVPPTMPVEEELVGEAEATEATMAGVELNEDDIRTRKIAEQIAEMIKASPTEAAGLFGRWIRKEG